MSECEWPFCHIPNCPSCEKHELVYSEGVEEWLKQKAEIRAAARRKGSGESGQ